MQDVVAMWFNLKGPDRNEFIQFEHGDGSSTIFLRNQEGAWKAALTRPADGTVQDIESVSPPLTEEHILNLVRNFLNPPAPEPLRSA